MLSKIPTISVRQPWASAIACGAKRIETRSWKTDYRGPLLIHAGKSPRYCRIPLGGDALCWNRYHGTGWDAANTAGFPHNWDNDEFTPLGAIIAVAELVGCYGITRLWQPAGAMLRGVYGGDEWEYEITERELALGDYTPGRYGWVLADVAPLTEPVPYKGRQGLFRVPLDAVRDKLPPEWQERLRDGAA